MRKYRNVKVTLDGHTFDSKREAARYGDLKLLERSGKVSRLELQPRYPLLVDGTVVATYIADFSYFEGDKRIVEDVKSKPTKTPLYRLKIKLLKAIYRGITHREIF